VAGIVTLAELDLGMRTWMRKVVLEAEEEVYESDGAGNTSPQESVHSFTQADPKELGWSKRYDSCPKYA
jgi:hypothetical protein